MDAVSQPPRGYRCCRSAQPRAVGAGNGSSKGTQTKSLVMLTRWSPPLPKCCRSPKARPSPCFSRALGVGKHKTAACFSCCRPRWSKPLPPQVVARQADRVTSHSTLRPVLLCCRWSPMPMPTQAGQQGFVRQSALCVYGPVDRVSPRTRTQTTERAGRIRATLWQVPQRRTQFRLHLTCLSRPRKSASCERREKAREALSFNFA